MRTDSTATSQQQAAMECGCDVASAPHRKRRATRRRPDRRALPAVLRAAGSLLALLLALRPGAPASGAPAYSIVDLGASFDKRVNSWPYDINASGQVLIRTSDPKSWLYDSTGMHDLSKLLGEFSGASAINDAGQIAGSLRRNDGENGSLGPPHPFLYDRTGVHELGTLTIELSEAADINAAGQVVGYGTFGGTGDGHAFLYSDGVMRDLGTLGSFSRAYAINNRGQVVGWSRVSYQPQVEHAFLYNNGVMRDLGALSTGTMSWASDINDLGQVVGNSTTDRNWGQNAFLYDAAGMRALGGLRPGEASVAYSINNHGQIVGYAATGTDLGDAAVLWENGEIKDLNRLIPPGSGWVLMRANAINDAGQIIGIGRTGPAGRDGSFPERAFLLNPTSLVPQTPPRAPSGLTVSTPPADPLSRLDLAWTDASNTESGFEIQRRASDTDWTTVTTPPQNTTGFSDTGLAAYTHYRYRVRAVNAAGNSGWSNEASGDTGTGPVLRLSAAGLEFGKQPVGVLSAPRTVALTNLGNAPLSIQSMELTGSGSDEFTILAGGGSGTLAPGASRNISIGFRPSATGSWIAALTLRTNAVDSPHQVSLSGAGGAPALTISVAEVSFPDGIAFGSQPLGAPGAVKTLTLNNTGSVPLKIDRISLGGTNRSEFALIADTRQRVLPPNASRSLTLRFTPMAAGPRSAFLTLQTNAAASSRQVALEGTGIVLMGDDAEGTPRPIKAELILAVDGGAPHTSKAAVAVGQCVTLRLRVKYRNGAVAELTEAPTVTFSASPARGEFSGGNVWCPQPEDAGRKITLYGRYAGSSGQPALVAKTSITVRGGGRR